MFPTLEVILADLAGLPGAGPLCRDLRGKALADGEGKAVDLALSVLAAAKVNKVDVVCRGWGEAAYPAGEVKGEGVPDSWHHWIGTSASGKQVGGQGDILSPFARLFTQAGWDHWKRVKV